MRIIRIDDADTALPEQKTLAVQILLERPMLRRSDVIRGKVGKYAVIKQDARRAVQFQSLRGHLHNHILASGFHHSRKHPVKFIGLRRRIFRRDVLITDHRADRSDQSDLLPRHLKYTLDHVGRRRFSLCTCNADRDQLTVRMSEQRRRHVGKRTSG